MRYSDRGDILYHGTAAVEAFEKKGRGVPMGPAWFSEGYGVAKYFMTWGAGPRPRILTYRVVVRPNLFKFRNMESLAKLVGLPKEDYVSVENLENYDPGFWVERLCATKYDGWIIPDNYIDGSDIMICEPERFLELVP
jgi:hypothetical protein